jgi:hypothetical protein
LSEFPKDFLFHPGRTMRDAIARVISGNATWRREKHGYEGVTNLFRALINSRAFVRVISSILA